MRVPRTPSPRLELGQRGRSRIAQYGIYQLSDRLSAVRRAEPQPHHRQVATGLGEVEKTPQVHLENAAVRRAAFPRRARRRAFTFASSRIVSSAPGGRAAPRSGRRPHGTTGAPYRPGEHGETPHDRPPTGCATSSLSNSARAWRARVMVRPAVLPPAAQREQPSRAASMPEITYSQNITSSPLRDRRDIGIAVSASRSPVSSRGRTSRPASRSRSARRGGASGRRRLATKRRSYAVNPTPQVSWAAGRGPFGHPPFA